MFICRDAINITTWGKRLCIVLAMATDKTCPERVKLVEKLAKAINKKSRVEHSKARPEERTRVSEEVGEALEEIRDHKARGGCKSPESQEPKAS